MSTWEARMVAGRRVKLDVEQLAEIVEDALNRLDIASHVTTNEERADVAVASVLFELALMPPANT